VWMRTYFHLRPRKRVVTKTSRSPRARGSDPRPCYGGSWFRTASALPLDGGFSSPRRLWELLLVAAAHPWRPLALILVLLRTPTIDLSLSDSAAGQLLCAYFNERTLGVFPKNMLCRGIAILPPSPQDYLHGRHRQTVRTNVRRAKAAGIKCKPIGSPSDFLAAALDVVHSRQDPEAAADLTTLAAGLMPHWQIRVAHPETTLLVAYDSAGEALAVAAVMIDDDVCVVRLAVASSHDARWALHHHLVLALIDRGVRLLMSDGGGSFGALGFTRQVQYFQRLHGYGVYHVKCRCALRR